MSPLGADMRQPERQQKRHNRDDERQIGEPRRVGRDERRNGIQHQEEGERRQRGALRSVDRMVTLNVCRTLIDIT